MMVTSLREKNRSKPKIPRVTIGVRLQLWCDSGAYSAWNREGVEIEIADYLRFLRKHEGLFERIVVLDQIPPSGYLAEEAAGQSRENLKRMKSAGFRRPIIPVFHFYESFKWLLRMIDDGEDYIGISPTEKVGKGDTKRWLDDVFRRLDKSRIRTHGFGVGSPELIWRYPWASCDSAAYVHRARNRKILVPIQHRGEPVFSVAPEDVGTSDDRQRVFRTPADLEMIEAWLDECGVTWEQVRRSEAKRQSVNIAYFESLKHAKRKKERSDFRFIHVNNRQRRRSTVLTSRRITDRLISYIDWRDERAETAAALRRLAQTGRF